MRKILNIIGFILVLAVIFVAVLNTDISFNLQIWGFKGTEQFGLPEINRNLNLANYTLLVLFVGIFTGASWIGQFYFAQKDKLNAYKRELEKSSITNSSSSSRVEVLEAKIATLEKALDDALNK